MAGFLFESKHVSAKEYIRENCSIQNFHLPKNDKEETSSYT